MHDHDHPHHDHSHDHGSALPEIALRVKALESILVEKGYIDPAAIDVIVETYETRVGPRNGARVVAKAWSDPAKAAPMLQRIPLGRFFEPEEVAETIAFLLSDKASMVNGVAMPVDGGFLIT